MSATNRSKGAAFETAIMKHLRSKGFDVERLRLAGSQDHGDLVWRNGGLVHVFEAKNTQVTNLTDFVRQAEVEAKNYQAARGLEVTPYWSAVIKKRQASVGESFVVMSLDEYVRLSALPF